MRKQVRNGAPIDARAPPLSSPKPPQRSIYYTLRRPQNAEPTKAATQCTVRHIRSSVTTICDMHPKTITTRAGICLLLVARRRTTRNLFRSPNKMQKCLFGIKWKTDFVAWLQRTKNIVLIKTCSVDEGDSLGGKHVLQPGHE